MKARSAMNKGNRFEIYLVDVIKENLDSNCHKTNASGAGLNKNDVRLPSFDIEIEAKNSETIHLIKDWEQAKSQETASTTVLAIRNPKKPEFQETLIVMDLHDWMELVKKQKDEITIEHNFSPDMKWKIKRLVDAAKQVFKGLE